MAIQQEQTLRELATTPLMLSVLLLTYREVSAEKIIQQGTELERQVWTDYVARQVVEKGNDTRYPLDLTRTWFAWFAQQMRDHQQTIFYAEYLQPDWLTQVQQRTAMWLATRLPAIALGVCVSLLIPLLFLGGGSNLLFRSDNMFQLGLLGGFVGDYLSQQVIVEAARAASRRSYETQVHFRNAVLLGILLAASYGLDLGPWYSLSNWVRDGSILGLGSGCSFWIFQELLSRIPSQSGKKANVRSFLRRDLTAWFTRMATPSVWQAALVLGAGIGLSIGLANWLSYELNLRSSIGLHGGLNVELGSLPSIDLCYGLCSGFGYGLSYGLNVSIMVMLVRAILASTIGSFRFTERIHWTWRSLLRPKHLRTSLIVAGALFLLIGLSVGLSYWVTLGLSGGLSGGLSTGISGGLSGGLSYWAVLGLYEGMKLEHLEDQDRQQFNQGVHRSLYNGLFISLISALIISIIGILSDGLGSGLDAGFYGQNYGLSYWLSVALGSVLSDGLSVGLILLFPGIVVMWALSGGFTVLRHYVIRWLLARHRTFPWRAQAFLDDATARILLLRVGGGYSFIHRRLQDYFADAVPPPS